MTIFHNIMEVKSPCCKNILHIYIKQCTLKLQILKRIEALILEAH